MGQAKKRGTFEERKDQAIKREEDRLLAIRAKSYLRNQQEVDAYRIMVWWQHEMSEQRYRRIMKRRLNTGMVAASIFGLIGYPGWNALTGIYRTR